jgi:hypothetical protein
VLSFVETTLCSGDIQPVVHAYLLSLVFSTIGLIMASALRNPVSHSIYQDPRSLLLVGKKGKGAGQVVKDLASKQ